MKTQFILESTMRPETFQSALEKMGVPFGYSAEIADILEVLRARRQRGTEMTPSQAAVRVWNVFMQQAPWAKGNWSALYNLHSATCHGQEPQGDESFVQLLGMLNDRMAPGRESRAVEIQKTGISDDISRLFCLFDHGIEVQKVPKNVLIARSDPLVFALATDLLVATAGNAPMEDVLELAAVAVRADVDPSALAARAAKSSVLRPLLDSFRSGKPAGIPACQKMAPRARRKIIARLPRQSPREYAAVLDGIILRHFPNKESENPVVCLRRLDARDKKTTIRMDAFPTLPEPAVEAPPASPEPPTAEPPHAPESPVLSDCLTNRTETMETPVSYGTESKEAHRTIDWVVNKTFVASDPALRELVSLFEAIVPGTIESGRDGRERMVELIREIDARLVKHKIVEVEPNEQVVEPPPDPIVTLNDIEPACVEVEPTAPIPAPTPVAAATAQETDDPYAALAARIASIAVRSIRRQLEGELAELRAAAGLDRERRLASLESDVAEMESPL